MSFKIVVDSPCDLTPQMRQHTCFHKVPLTIQCGGSVFVDDDTFDQGDLLRVMKESPTAPSTACPSPQDYLDAYKKADPQDDIYVITLSALLSGSYNCAEQARLLLEEEEPHRNVHVFNSCSASPGEVLIALKIQALAEQGLPFKQVVREVEAMVANIHTLFVLESLENLRKNGRLNRVQSLVTGALKIKLFMGSTPEGEICKLGQALTIKQALGKMVDKVASDPEHKGKPAAICHCNCPERAAQVKAQLEAKCQLGEIHILEAGGITTVYAEQGGIVMAY